MLDANTRKILTVKCQSCSNPATVHLTDIVQGVKKEVHLCEDCAQQQQLINKQELNLSAILQSVIGQHVGATSDELSRLSCPNCGMKYMEFKAEGRLGCPQDYEVFQSALEPLLERMHRGKRHTGKKPPNALANLVSQQEIMSLRTQLRAAVDAEEYEEAARLRDLIREKEAANEPG